MSGSHAPRRQGARARAQAQAHAATSRQGWFERTSSRVGEGLDFFSGFLKSPEHVGAVLPSSQLLARQMIRGLPLEKAGLVVELGPGTGSFTGPILDRLSTPSSFFALEIDKDHCWALRRKFPGVRVHHDSAERLGHYVERHPSGAIDYVISGLPWASLPVEVQDKVFKAVLNSLAPNGTFVTFAYLHAKLMPNARLFRQRLHHHFEQVTLSPVVWWNLPPAFVYTCTQRRKA